MRFGSLRCAVRGQRRRTGRTSLRPGPGRRETQSSCSPQAEFRGSFAQRWAQTEQLGRCGAGHCPSGWGLTAARVKTPAKGSSAEAVLELTLKNDFSSLVFSNILVPLQVLLFLGGVRNRVFSLSLSQKAEQEITTIPFHTLMTCHALVTYALQQEVLPSGARFVLSRVAVPQTPCSLQSV